MMSLSSLHQEEQVKGKSAKRKKESPSNDRNYPGRSFLGFYFCILHFAFCLLTCCSLSPATTAPREEACC
jgi:hypothetical protein